MRGIFSVPSHFSLQSRVGQLCEQLSMDFPTIILLVLAVVAQTESAYRVTDFAIYRNCTEVFSITTPRYVPYEESYRTRNWLGFTKWKTRTNYRIENHVSHQRRSVCCNGYTNYGSTMCMPLCSKSCGSFGVCSQPETCKCFQGYSVDHAVNECRPVCSNECVNGRCTSPEICTCNDGFHKLSDGFTCQPICNNCTSLEFCDEPHVCRCITGYHRASLDRLDRSTDTSPCEPVCGMPCINADCVAPDRCACHVGYEDLDGDVYSCEPKCSHGCKDGYCTAPETCTCLPGYKLTEPHSNVCEPVCTDECVNADCIAPNLCSCRDGYIPAGGELSHVCAPYCNSSCAHGHCSEPETCSCDAGYVVTDDRQTCEPLCTEACYMGSCTAPDTCTCQEGYKLSEHSNFTCEPSCSQGCINGNCTAPNECTCNEGYEIKSNSSNECIVICECENGFCNDDSSSCETCSEGYELTHDVNSTLCQPHCEGNCSSRGQCVEPQHCDCEEKYVADNDTLGNPVCLHACGGDCQHGTCDVIGGFCSCYYGWTGKFCEEALVCVVLVHNESGISWRHDDWDGYDASGNWTVKEDPWTGPTCQERCLHAIDNSTKCLNDTDSSQVTCYMSIESSCNSPSVVMANLYKSDMSIVTIVAGCGISMLLLATVISATLVFKKRQKRRETIAMTSSEQEQPEAEEDRLIENDNDGISL